MRRPTFDKSWSDSFKASYLYDELELWNGKSNLGYKYSYRNRRQPILDAVKQSIPRGGAILDVAAASGNFSLPLAEQGFRLVWNDLRAEYIDWVKMKYEYGNIEYLVGNIFEKSTSLHENFDGVIATEVVEHVAHPDQFLTSLAAMVKPGGRIFMTTPNGRYFRNSLPKFSECVDPSIFEAVQFAPNSDGHIFLLHPDEIIELSKRCDLDIEYFALANNPLTNGHIKLGHVLPYVPEFFVSIIESLTRKLPRAMRERLHSTSIVIFKKK
jgi:2-polyprenyl-6-hydroxyphenyl methylase/3-demethylubiquinone-9 3-methyltransferase